MIFFVVIIVALIALNKARNPKHPLQLNVYFGVPGSGKTTFAAYLARQAQKESLVIKLCKRFPCRYTRWILRGKHWKRAYPVWSNVPINGTFTLDAKTDIGVFMIQDGKMIIDEAGVEFNNRDYKAQNFYVVRKSLLPMFVVVKRIKRKVGIDDVSHQIIDKYYFGLPILDSKWIFCPPLWKMFNSYDCDTLPDKEWTYWNAHA